MSHNNELNSVELRELRGAFSGVRLPDAPALDRVMARGGAHRRHRRYWAAAVSLAGITAATASAFGFTGGSAAPASKLDTVQSAATGSKLGPIRTVAYTLVSNADGIAKLTIHPAELIDPVRLQNDLEHYGIPAKVTVGSICSTDPAPAESSRVYSFDPGQPGGDATITIDPSAISAGDELSFGQIQIPSEPGVVLAQVNVIDKKSYTCSSTLPTDLLDQDSGNGAQRFYANPSNAGQSTKR
jgi:hypothetical protein